MDVRRIRAYEGPRLREVRLRALAEVPEAFGSTLAEEQAKPPEDWDERARIASADESTALFVAEDDHRWHGLVGSFVHRDHPQVTRLVSMWVDPSKRRSGIGTALVDEVIRWSRDRGAACVQLWVTESNEPALALYARSGFARTNHTKPLPSNPSHREVLMVRMLAVDPEPWRMP
jgi:ribosomal protein S18 acetylase RimI-like enzyme